MQVGGSASACPKWRQVLDLGAQLLHLMQQSPADFAAQHRLIQETAARLLGAEALFWQAGEALHRFAGKALANVSPLSSESLPAAPLSALMEDALQKHVLCAGASGASETCWTLPLPDSAQPCALAVPLLLAERTDPAAASLGVLQVERPAGPPFEAEDIEFLDGLAAQVALALQAGLQMSVEHWRLGQLSLVGQVSAQIADVRDLDELARRVTDLIQRTFNYYYVAIFTLEPSQDILHFRASAGPARQAAAQAGQKPFSPKLVVHMGQGIIGHVAQSGQELLADDVEQERMYQHLDALPETRSEASLPLKIENRLLGVLDVQSDQPGYFDETDLLVLRALAGNIAFAIEGARLYGALNQRAGQLSAIHEVSSAITSILDQEKLLDEVVSLIHKRFGYPFIHLFTVHPERCCIVYEAGSGSDSQALRQQDFSYALDDPQGLVPWVARHGETILANDVMQEPRYRVSVLPPDETLSELTVPLVFGGNVLGVLDIQSDQLNAFGEDDRFLFEALAHTIAIAMRNATLYRSETWRRQAADSLREVAGLLSADVSLDEVLEAILKELERTLPLDIAAIWLLDEETSLVDSSAEDVPLHLAAVHGERLKELGLEAGLSPQDVLEFSVSETSDLQPEQASAWLLQALNNGQQPLIRTPQSSFDPLGAALNFPADYSAIATPLRVGERTLGVLTLAHHTPGRYGNESRAMTAAFASYAAVAIQNTRLYEEAHEQAWVSTILLQVADATQSLTNLNDLLETVVHITPTLAGVKACLLYTLDEDGVFVPAAASGLQPEQQAEFERWRFSTWEVPALEQMYNDHQPVILHSDGEDRSLAGIFFNSDNEGNRSPYRSELLVLVPLVARGEVLGAFLVDYDPGLHGSATQDLETFFDERLAIIQGIAHQTAVAVENVRLIKSQKEEAYVSVALLQVAQAVVSSNDLDEALGSIVRITPILVGVKRAIAFLWDEAHNVFRLSQSYGIPRDATSCQYTRGEFLLLDAVYQSDSLVAYPLNSAETVFKDVPDDWSFLIPPDPEEVEDYLENETCLLLAFPLSVKGKVLGVLLVEEPDAASTEGFDTSPNANRRLRSKRMEIITGISQQAALAIQNDLLQHEMVEREHLEREMQLARDIQRTFLPQTLPELPGWELKVCWRTARQVGGDFYDFFELPDGRLGMVIADVADKGMPAALFMTLVRTLVRATVQQMLSPSDVLQRVNDILVPDARDGMFVTLAYAVLSPKTGELEYANAGHNPPVLVRQRDCQLEHLERSGMALGVVEGTPIESRKIALEPGDYLVMYTDGVTEAFSPQGELFGEERLLAAIREAATCVLTQPDAQTRHAQDMLDAIDGAVTAFISEAARSDDLTLVVLKRQ